MPPFFIQNNQDGFMDRPIKNKAVLALMVLAIGAAVFLVYSNTLTQTLVWDDHYYVKKFSLRFNSFESLFLPVDLEGAIMVFYRPMAGVSYLLDYSLWHENHVGYHLTNLLLHMLNSLMLFMICLRLKVSLIAAFLGSMLFAVHPIHTESVSWISARLDLIAAAFVMLAFICHAEYAKGDKKAVIPAVLFFSFALFSKEIALAAVIVFALYEILIAKKKIGIMPYALYGLSATIYFVMRYAYLSNSTVNIAFKPFTDILVLFFSATGFYFYKFIFPFNLSIYIAHIPNVPLFFILGAALFIITALLYVKGRRIAAFLLSSFIVTLMPSVAGSFTTILSPPFAERYLYLPSAFLCIAASAGIVRFKPFGKYVLAAVLIVSGIAAFQRNDVWKSEALLWKDTIQKTEHWYPQIQYAGTLSSEGKYESSLRMLNNALDKAVKSGASQKALSRIYNNIGQVHIKKGEQKASEGYFEKSLSLDETNPVPFYNLAEIMLYSAQQTNAGDRNSYLAKAEAYYKKALENDPYFFEANLGIGKLYYKMGNFAESAKYYEKVLNAAPNTIYSAEALDALLQPSMLKVK
ncbi:MAG: tetratricopeptide repeat protein [Dissulfurispiraceae bacterium]|jgi:hypothetical protein|nr:tetratricopeptide repeat protein [Dissulfurispiraceae bacterium]